MKAKRIVLEDNWRRIFGFVKNEEVYGTYVEYKFTKQGARLSDGVHRWVYLGKLKELEKEFDIKELKFDQ